MSSSEKKCTLSAVHYAVLALGALVVIAALLLYVPRIYSVSTDDTYVQADTVTVIPKVPDYVVALHASDNSSFSKGECWSRSIRATTTSH